MFFMVTTIYPHDKATEMGKAFIGLPKLPSFLKLIHVLTSTDLTGIKAYALYEVENKKVYEGFLAIVNRYVAFMNIVGFRYRVEPLMTPEEGLPMIGLTPPK